MSNTPRQSATSDPKKNPPQGHDRDKSGPVTKHNPDEDHKSGHKPESDKAHHPSKGSGT